MTSATQTAQRLAHKEPKKEILHCRITLRTPKFGYTLVTLPRIVTPYRDSVDGIRDRVTCQKLVTR
jgi:hypothetical protein